MSFTDARRLPVVSLGAEHLVIGHLMRRNILAYKAPPNNEGYDLICIHPDPSQSRRAVRVQVKSRYQTDCDRAFPVRERTFNSFDFLIIVFLNIGDFYPVQRPMTGQRDPEFFTLPVSFIRKHHYAPPSGFEKIRTKGVALERYKNEAGFERIAMKLGIPYPGTAA
jgi:hypothetical protein